MSKPATLRCAVYTRKSSEEGLEQEYNSLHAQRDACEAYIKSQVGEGWTCLKTAYDDGGISGGTMDRPGLKQLLADIAARRIDVVVVYKVDRLTRSLWDFAKIVEVFDKHQVSFVSVTQSFNTTSSMGRLTLNMLLSFAQFEREVTSERIRDKIAASKARGMWMGGGVPLGYVAEGRTLKIHETEAEAVRYIFRRYLELKSVHRLKAVLDEEGVRSKLSVFASGRTRGGCAMDRGALFKLLSNPAYLGKVKHKDKIYDGLHPAIIDRETFDAVGVILRENSVARTSGSKRRTSSPLMGILFDDEGEPMTPTFTTRPGGKVYRYYVSAGLQQGKAIGSGIQRLPAPRIEQLVAQLADRLRTSPSALLVRIDVRTNALQLTFKEPERSQAVALFEATQNRLIFGERAWTDEGAPGTVVVSTPIRAVFRGGRAIKLDLPGPTPMSPKASLVAGLRRAHDPAILDAAAPKYERRLAPLRFLAPDIQAAILTGQHRLDLTLDELTAIADHPLWSEQRSVFS